MKFQHSKPGGHHLTSGFTLVEIMIVVVIIGLLAAMGFPVWAKSRRNAQNTAFISDLRIATYAAQVYALEAGGWAPDVGAGVAPPELIPYLNKLNWTDRTPIGGLWDWQSTVGPPQTAGIRVSGLAVGIQQLQEIDTKIDDGVATTGRFQYTATDCLYVLE